VESMGPGGFEERTVADWVVDDRFSEHGIVLVFVDFDTSTSHYLKYQAPFLEVDLSLTYEASTCPSYVGYPSD
jgi:hypothetical protein